MSEEKPKWREGVWDASWGKPIDMQTDWPIVYALFNDGVNGSKLPAPGDTDGLFEFFQACDQGPDDGDGEDIQKYSPTPYRHAVLNLALAKEGKPTWRMESFERAYDKFLEIAEDAEKSVIELAKREADSLRRSVIGGSRRKTTLSNDALAISAGCQVTLRRAYEIIREGCGNFETRKKLAKCFAGDPTRNYPAAWELKRGRSWGIAPAKDSFKVYCTKRRDDFDDFTDIRLQFAELYKRGVLLPSFKNAGELVQAIIDDGLDIDLALAVGLFGDYLNWRKFG
jgi:hypothetical protein